MTDHDLLSTPAGRLALLFRACRKAHQKSTQQNPVRVGAALQGYLGIAAEDTAGYFAAVAEIMSMPVTIRRDVAALENPVLPASMMLRHMDTVEAVLPYLGQPTQNVKAIIDRVGNEIIEGLEACSHILAERRAEAVLPSDTLEGIRKLATEIIDDLAEAGELSREFREEIRRHAQSIIESVNMYKVHGADGLLDEADALVGVYVRHYAEDPVHQGKPASSVLRKVRELTGEILLAVAVVTAPFELASSMDAYAHVLELPVSVQAPDEDIQDADVVEDDEPA